MRLLAVFFLVFHFLPAKEASAQSLPDKIMPLVKEHAGDVAVAIRNLETKEEFLHQADKVLPTASLIKFPIMVEAFYQKQEGIVDFQKDITFNKDDMVPGSGVITTYFNPGGTLKLQKSIHLMIAYSDNTATNLVLDQIQIPSTNKRMALLGFPETQIHSKVYKRSTSSIDLARSEKYGLGSTKAKDMIDLLQMLHENKLVDEKACKEMKRYLADCDHFTALPRLLPPEAKVQQKTGAVNKSRTAAGIVYPPKGAPFAICVLTNDNKDESWTNANAGELVISKITKAAYDYFTTDKK